MGKVLSIVSNPFKNFNLESRAHKIISQTKPRPAPRHEKDQLDIDRLMKEYPEAYQESLKKDEQLDKHLKDVYVTSRDVTPEVKRAANPDRPLPIDRSATEWFLYGVKEPEKASKGKTTLSAALEFLTRHQNEPRTYTAKRIADEFTIPEETINTLKKFHKE